MLYFTAAKLEDRTFNKIIKYLWQSCPMRPAHSISKGHICSFPLLWGKKRSFLEQVHPAWPVPQGEKKQTWSNMTHIITTCTNISPCNNSVRQTFHAQTLTIMSCWFPTLTMYLLLGEKATQEMLYLCFCSSATCRRSATSQSLTAGKWPLWGGQKKKGHTRTKFDWNRGKHIQLRIKPARSEKCENLKEDEEVK